MTYREAVDHLRAALGAPLPGDAAHVLLAPRPRHGWTPGHLPASARAAAGLIAVFEQAGAAHFVLTRRGAGLTQHASQVSLPGGAVDPGETIEEAALREAEEEVGFPRGAIEVLGLLTPLYIPVSGFTLHPVVGAVRETPHLVASAIEVEEILRVPLRVLIDAYPRVERRVLRDGAEYDVPHFRLLDAEVWGATAMILAEFRSLWEIRR
jgi:8-oxo-dGTP pyrophosphatase MutT (NUDIX family)